jgi:hypothetical protein
VYGASAGGGFAVFENIFYVLDNGFETAILRAVLSVPGHIFWGSISGYWLAKFKIQGVGTLPMLTFGLGVAVISHGLFNTFLSFSATIVLAPVVILYSGWLTKKYFKEALKHDLENFNTLQTVETSTDLYLENTRTNQSIIYSSKSIAVTSTNPRLKKLLMHSLSFFGFGFFVFGSLLILYAAENWSPSTDLADAFMDDGIAILTFLTIASIFFFYSYKLKRHLEFNHAEIMKIQGSSLIRGLFLFLAFIFALVDLIFLILILTGEVDDGDNASSIFILFYLSFFTIYFLNLGRRKNTDSKGSTL